MGDELGKQLLYYPRALSVLTVMLVIMAFMPGLPMFPFLLLAGVTLVVIRLLKKWNPELSKGPGVKGALERKAATTAGGSAGADGAAGARSDGAGAGAGEKLESLLKMDALQIELIAKFLQHHMAEGLTAGVHGAIALVAVTHDQDA